MPDDAFLKRYEHLDRLDRRRYSVVIAVIFATLFGGPQGTLMREVLAAGREAFIARATEMAIENKLSRSDLERVFEMLLYVAKKNIPPEKLLQIHG